MTEDRKQELARQIAERLVKKCGCPVKANKQRERSTQDQYAASATAWMNRIRSTKNK